MGGRQWVGEGARDQVVGSGMERVGHVWRAVGQARWNMGVGSGMGREALVESSGAVSCKGRARSGRQWDEDARARGARRKGRAAKGEHQ